ncbi:Rrf2 family transcriptional regulator [Neptunicella sp. SCSIO 80796]|uniref:Rrf2 family transcriptional regulator n=1 Tax=Neptunicella plasticusilytica TaxID=3117012 RepID=UPI003A4E4CCF
MQLTRYTDYALRILTYLAVMPQGQQANIEQISKRYNLSVHHLKKIVQQLGIAGIVATKRGKGGGISLMKSPGQINVGEVVTLLENTLDVIDCHSAPCQILPACRLKNILAQATQSFIQTLNQYTLADLVADNKGDLIELLQIER